MKLKHIAVAILALVLLGSVTHPPKCHASDLSDVIGLYAGVNGVWHDGDTAGPADIEAAFNAKASLSPHLTYVGSVNYGFDGSYFRWATGPRVTVSDVDNRNFSIGIGMQYHGGSQADVDPREWAVDATVGYVPWPQSDADWANKVPRTIANRISVGIWGWRGMRTENASLAVGARYELPY